MKSPESETLDLRIESTIDAFEESLAEHGSAMVADFFPDRSDPLFSKVAAELIRVDLELAWEAGNQKSLNDYKEVLPELVTDSQLRADIAFEEYRQRCEHGQPISLEEFSNKYDVETTGWSTVVSSKDETRTTEQFNELAKRVPTEGQRWRDFEIIREIGRGALSRVLLAKQTSLSSRQVVLKFAPKHLLEAEKLARLQHPNIVPVFSVYEDRDFHVFCMPYLGDETLLGDEANASTTDTRQTGDGALQVFEQLASAIEHAHQRGILHNDIKPANVLWVDEQPMLLDFNLAASTTDRSESQIGGTLPYMAPEALAGLSSGKQSSDERSDLFSLGALIFELATGKAPFGNHKTIEATLESRNHLDRGLLRSKVTPSFAAIVENCLAIDPAKRYQTASELLQDTQNEREHLPLQFANESRAQRIKKWTLRHPRLTSWTTLAAVASVLIAISLFAWFAREKYVAKLEAKQTFVEFSQAVEQLVPELSSIGLEGVDPTVAIQDAEETLARFVSINDQSPDWRGSETYDLLDSETQQAIDHEVTRLALMTSESYLYAYRNDKAADHLGPAERWNLVASLGNRKPSRARLDQLSRIKVMQGDDQQADSLREAAANATLTTATDLQLVGHLSRVHGNTTYARDVLMQACEQDPQDFSKWYNLAQTHMDLGDWQQADQCLTACLVLKDSPLARYARGISRNENNDPAGAARDFTKFLPHTEDGSYGRHCCLLNRAIAYKDLKQYRKSLADLNTAIDSGYKGVRPLLIRSRVKKRLGDHVGAASDHQLAMKTTPRDELGWVALGVAKMSKQPAEALTDFEKAIELNPRSHSARRNVAHVLSARLARPAKAIEVLAGVCKDYPNDDSAFAGRGILLARAGKFAEAIEDAKKAVEINQNPRAMFQAACIYSLASRANPELRDVAVSLLGSSFKVRPSLVSLAVEDTDLIDIHGYLPFKQLCAAAARFAAVPDASQVIKNTESK